MDLGEENALREAILALRLVIKMQNRKMKTTFITFVDLEKAFDNIKWEIIFKILKRVSVTYKDRRIIKCQYEQEIGIEQCRNSQEKAKIRNEVRQGCTISIPF